MVRCDVVDVISLAIEVSNGTDPTLFEKLEHAMTRRPQKIVDVLGPLLGMCSERGLPSETPNKRRSSAKPPTAREPLPGLINEIFGGSANAATTDEGAEDAAKRNHRENVASVERALGVALKANNLNLFSSLLGILFGDTVESLEEPNGAATIHSMATLFAGADVFGDFMKVVSRDVLRKRFHRLETNGPSQFEMLHKFWTKQLGEKTPDELDALKLEKANNKAKVERQIARRRLLRESREEVRLVEVQTKLALVKVLVVLWQARHNVAQDGEPSSSTSAHRSLFLMPVETISIPVRIFGLTRASVPAMYLAMIERNPLARVSHAHLIRRRLEEVARLEEDAARALRPQLVGQFPELNQSADNDKPSDGDNNFQRTPSVSQTSARSFVIRRRYPLVVDLGTEDVAMKLVLSRCKFMRSPIDGAVVRRSDFEDQQRSILELQHKQFEAKSRGMFHAYGASSKAEEGYRDPIILMVSLDDIRCIFQQAAAAHILEHPNHRKRVEVDEEQEDDGRHCLSRVLCCK